MGKVIITGVTKGIGKALCKKYLSEGYSVIGISSKQEHLNALASDLLMDSLELFKCDISNNEDLNDFRDYLAGQNIVSLINNVGVGYYSRFIDCPIEKVEFMINTNLMGTIKLTQIILKQCTSGLKNITFLSSLTGKIGFNGLTVYSATKHGIEGFANALREELRKQGIGVLIVRPGIVDTDFFNTAQMEAYTRGLKNKMQTPELVSKEVFRAWEQGDHELTIGNDRLFLFLRRFVPISFERKLLNFFIS